MTAPSLSPSCPLCHPQQQDILWSDRHWYVIHAQEPGFPAFFRVVARRHVAEFSDLPASMQLHCMQLVATIERSLRNQLHPTKVNLASLGNMVPHLHWHIVARFDWDSHFPAPIWAPAQRPVNEARLAAVQAQMPQVVSNVKAALRLLVDPA
jgi:diadenosine tetraphosphate (Ap4A) HIT family hydrolase